MSEDRRLIDKLHCLPQRAARCRRGVIEYTEQLTNKLFLKVAHERATGSWRHKVIVPEEFSRQWLSDADSQELETDYSQILTGLTSQPGTWTSKLWVHGFRTNQHFTAEADAAASCRPR